MLKKTSIYNVIIVMLFLLLTAKSYTAEQQELNVVSWGGAYSNSQEKAYHEPFAKKMV